MKMFNPTCDMDEYEANHTDTPDYQWSSESFCLAEVCRRFGLPQVIRYDRCGSLARIVNFDLTQTLLAYSARAARKVCATGVGETGVTTTEPIIIPNDYKGWFSILRPDCMSPFYTAINSIALSNVTSFLVTTRLPGFQIVRETGKYIPRFILPGEVLQVSKTYVGTKKVKEKYIFKRKKSVEVRYLMCLDANEREVLFNMDQKGSFYAVTVSGKVQSSCCIMRMTDILEKLHFPADVRLVFGRKPMSAATLPSELRLNVSFMDDSVVAMTMSEGHKIFLELPKLNSPLRFKIAAKTEKLTKSSVFAQTLRMCEEGVDVYMKDIKVSLSSAVNDQHYYNTLQTQNTPRYQPSRIPIPKGSSTPNLVHNSCMDINTTRHSSVSDVRGDIRNSLPTSLRKPSMFNKIFGKEWRQSSNSNSNLRCSESNLSSPSSKMKPKLKSKYMEYECIWKTDKKPPVVRRGRDKTFPGSTSVDAISDKAACRLSFEGTYIVIPEVSNNLPYAKTSSEKNSNVNLYCTNSLETVSENFTVNKNHDYANTDAMTRSYSEDNLIAQLSKSCEVDYKNLSEVSVASSEPKSQISGDLMKDNDFFATLKRVRPVEQALRVSVHGDIEGWDVVVGAGSDDTQFSHDSGYISMNDLDGGRANRDNSEVNHDAATARTDDENQLPEISIMAESPVETDASDAAYVAMNDLRDDYTHAKVTRIDTDVIRRGSVSSTRGVNGSFGSNTELTQSNNRSLIIQTKSVTEIAELLRCCGLREGIVQQFIDEKVDGKLLASLDLSIIRETFPDLRAIEAKKVWMMVTNGWLPNENSP